MKMRQENFKGFCFCVLDQCFETPRYRVQLK